MYIYIHTYIYMTSIRLLFFFLSAMADTNQMAFTASFLILRFVKTKQKYFFQIHYMSIIYFRLQYLCVECKTLEKGVSTD